MRWCTEQGLWVISVGKMAVAAKEVIKLQICSSATVVTTAVLLPILRSSSLEVARNAIWW